MIIPKDYCQALLENNKDDAIYKELIEKSKKLHLVSDMSNIYEHPSGSTDISNSQPDDDSSDSDDPPILLKRPKKKKKKKKPRVIYVQSSSESSSDDDIVVKTSSRKKKKKQLQKKETPPSSPDRAESEMPERNIFFV